MKEGSDNFRLSAVQGIMQRIKSRSINVVVYEPYLKASNFYGFQVIKSLDQVKSSVDVIVANRYSSELSGVENKLFTRDLFQNN
jgi:UDPglucose 6-dehydrogenase